jgi:hypothetical protein
MRLFQNCALMPSYVTRLNELAAPGLSFDERHRAFLEDRFGAIHILEPLLDNEPDGFLACGNDEAMQRQWAKENGVRADLTAYGAVLGNFPSLLDAWRRKGCRASGLRRRSIL